MMNAQQALEGFTGEGVPGLVSVIMPVRNGGVFIPLAVGSILAQAGVELELIVVDDGSTDDTAAWLAGLDDPRLRIVTLPGCGIPVARNTALAATRGEFIACMDADDVAVPHRLARQLAGMRANPGAGIVFSAARVIDAQGQQQGMIGVDHLTRDERRAVLLDERAGQIIVNPTTMFRRSVLVALGGYRPVAYAEDHDLWLRAVDHVDFLGIDEPLLDYRHHSGGVSRARAVEQSLLGVMNAATYRLNAAHGIDLLAQAPGIYAELLDWARGAFAPRLAVMAAARQIRGQLRRGPRLTGAFAALRHVAMGRPLGMAGLHRALVACQKEAADKGLALYTGRRA